jgi:hypothetical protein
MPDLYQYSVAAVSLMAGLAGVSYLVNSYRAHQVYLRNEKVITENGFQACYICCIDNTARLCTLGYSCHDDELSIYLREGDNMKSMTLTQVSKQLIELHSVGPTAKHNN